MPPLNTDDWDSLAKIDPELEELMKHTQLASLGNFSSVQDMRDMMRQAKLAAAKNLASGSQIPDDIEEVYYDVPMRDGNTIKARVFIPKKAPSDGAPLIVQSHGGGYVIGDLDSELMTCTRLTQELGLVTVNIDYRLAPEHKFPTAVTDGYDAVKWVAANASKLKADLSKAFLVGGTSAGAGISQAISHLARNDKLSPPLTGIYLSIPPGIPVGTCPEKYQSRYTSHEQNKNAPILDEAAIDFFMKNYAADKSSPMYAPLKFEGGQKGLPPHYFQICGMDPLRDEGLIYETILKEEGVKTKVDVYQGLPHGFWSFLPPTISASKTFVQEMVEGIRWLVDQSKK